MTKPSTLPTWATDSTLSGGPQVGQATRLDPGSGIRAQGLYQGRKVPARILGWMLGTIGDWLGWFDGVVTAQQLRCWDVAPIDPLAASPSVNSFLLPFVPAGAASAIGIPATVQRLIAQVGNYTSGSGHSEMSVLADMPNEIWAASDTGFAPFSCVASDSADPFGGAQGSVVFGCVAGGTTCKYSTNGGNSWTTFTPTGIGSTATAVFATPNSAHYLLSDRSGSILSATSLVSTWASHTYGLGGDGIVSFAAGNGVICGINYKTFGSSSSDRQIVYSNDDGVTWAAGQTFASLAISLTFSVERGVFVVIDGNGGLWTSVTGVTFTLQKTSSALATGIAPGAAQLACEGPAIAHIVNRSVGATPYHMKGIAYTLDLGATWYETYFATYSTSAAFPLGQLIAANGRFYASDPHNLYRSGPLRGFTTPNYLGS